MKILFFIDSLESGGKERRLTELMKSLIKFPEIEFQLVVMSKKVHYKDVFDLGITIHYLIRTKKKDPSVIFSLYKLCKTVNPSIIHCWDSMTAIYSIPISVLLKIPLLNGMIVNAPRNQSILNKYWLRAKLSFPFSQYIIGNSHAGIQAYKAPIRKSQVIYNGFNFSRLCSLIPKELIKKQLEIKPGYVIGMIATFSKSKDYTTYFSAASIILNKRNDITFIAVGNQTDSEEAMLLIPENQRVYFRLLGKRTDIESLANIFDIGVLVTHTEGISNAILEMMALGKPIIATDGGGTKEIVSDRETGFLVRESDPTDLVQKIELLLDNNELLINMGLKGKRRISEFFSIEEMTSKYINLYKRCNH